MKILALVILTAVPALALSADQAKHEVTPDTRTMVEFPHEIKQAMLTRMRRNLQDIHRIQAALAKKDFSAAADVAEFSLGLSSLGPHNARQAPFMPPTMHTWGWRCMPPAAVSPSQHRKAMWRWRWTNYPKLPLYASDAMLLIEPNNGALMMTPTSYFLVIFGLLVGAPALAHDPAGPQTIEQHSADRVSPNIYVVHSPRGLPNKANYGFINNPAFIVAKGGVIVVDPGGSLQVGAELVRKIRKVTDKPVIAILNTHIHGDHWLGNDGVRRAFPQAAIYAHPRMVERMRLGEGERWLERFGQMTEGAIAGTRVVAPTIGVGDGETLTLGGLRFRFHHFKAHTDTDIMIEVTGDKTLFLGDIVAYRTVPSRNQPQDAYFKGQLEATRTATQFPVKLYIPGHGPTGDRNLVLESLRFQEKLYSAVTKYFRQGLSEFEMKEPIQRDLSEYKDWNGFESMGQVINRIYLEVEADSF